MILTHTKDFCEIMALKKVDFDLLLLLLLLLLLSFFKKHPPDFYNSFQHVANIKGFIIYFSFACVL
jgi:hypothetical protein